MDSHELLLVDFDETHLEGALALSTEAHWPHRREDWDLVRQLSSGVVALDGARVLGTAFATPFGGDAATINMVIVAEAARGRGLGRRLMQAALDRCQGRQCRLIATADGLPLYEKLGFKATGEIWQHQGVSPGGRVPDGVAWAGVTDLAAVIDLDRRACGMDRADLIAAFAARGRFAILRQDGGQDGGQDGAREHGQGGAIVGFAALRRFGRGEVIGPVVAASDAAARDLLTFLLAARQGAFLRVDTPEAGLAAWLATQGLQHVGGGIAMRRDAHRPDPARPAVTYPAVTCPDVTCPADPVRTYALASQALG